MPCLLDIIEGKLATFVSQSQNLLSATSSLLAADSPEDILRKRTAWLSQTHFTPDEASETARLILRVLDRAHHFHCAVAQCGEECEFYLERCGNEGCGKIYSRKWSAKHDSACPHKILPCERECGENAKRLLMKDHLDNLCGLRTVRCPCYDLGCKTGLYQTCVVSCNLWLILTLI